MAFGFILILWSKWNIRGFVMLNLWLQVFFILFAPLRKKTTNRFIISLLWLAYLMADWVVAFTVGLISHSSNSSVRIAGVDGALRAFWASFLLLHLGGPDTITAFSLEDSSLWRRHLLSLVFQVSSAIYVFVEIFPRDKSLMIPTILVFLARLIKNAERMAALFFSSLPKLREWVFSQHKYPQDVAKLARNLIVSQLKPSDEEEVKLAESIVVKHAYYFFQMFKVLLGDLMFTFEEWKVSREYFQNVSTMDAFRVISIELQLMYEVLHTKTLVIRSKVVRINLCLQPFIRVCEGETKTYAEAPSMLQHLLLFWSGTTLEEMKEKCPGIVNVKTLCNYLYKIPLEHSTNISTLHEGIKLAHEMDSLREKKWEVMSGVWVEMLSYTASHIQGETHVQVLCRGGELLAFVWLLMAHFGCFYKPEWGIYADYHRLE